MKTYLVTGGAGFIGSNFIIYMLNKYRDIKIINVDSLTYAGNLENLKSVENDPNYSFVQADIRDHDAISRIFAENTIDYVVNFAAESHVDRSISDPEIFVRTNVLGTVNLLNIAKAAWQTGDDTYREGVKFHRSRPMRSTARSAAKASLWRPLHFAPTRRILHQRHRQICL